MGAQWKQKGREASANAKGRIFTKLGQGDHRSRRATAPIRHERAAARSPSRRRRRHRCRARRSSARSRRAPACSTRRSTYETVIYEGFAPHQVPVIVECLTDNKNRTATNIRLLFRKGQLGRRRRVVGLHARRPRRGDAAGGADPEEAAIEAGAQDFEPDGEGGFRFYTEPPISTPSRGAHGAGLDRRSAFLGWRAKNPVAVSAAARAEVEAFLAALDEDDDVQHIYVGLSEA